MPRFSDQQMQYICYQYNWTLDKAMRSAFEGGVPVAWPWWVAHDVLFSFETGEYEQLFTGGDHSKWRAAVIAKNAEYWEERCQSTPTTDTQPTSSETPETSRSD